MTWMSSLAGKRSRPLIIMLVILIIVAAGVWLLPTFKPIASLNPGEVGIRTNQLTGSVVEFREGGMLILPGIHHIRRFSLQDQVYRPTKSSRATGEAPFQSIEGLSIGVDLTIRYALNAEKLNETAKRLPEDIDHMIVQPLVEGVIYKIFARHTVREIFSSKRQEIQKTLEDELKPLLAIDGIILRAVFMGNVDLPKEYRAGMDNLLAEELNSEKMRFTLELKEKAVRQKELEGEALKVGREKAAEAAGNEEIISAKSKAEAMKHVLPFKQKQIEQRQLEAEADKVARLKGAEATADARRIEASGEADSRRKLAEADAYRVDLLGKASTEQLERDSALITKNPLLIQKTMADKLADKISVIIAPPPESGGFIAAGILGTNMTNQRKLTTGIDRGNDKGDGEE